VWAAAAALTRCPRVPPELQRSTAANVGELRESLRGLLGRNGGVELAEASCRAAAEVLQDTARLLGCR
jgi:hypothetical protein